jgi:hypothetical protein
MTETDLRVIIDYAYLIPGIEDKLTHNQIYLWTGCTTNEIDLVKDGASETNTIQPNHIGLFENSKCLDLGL